MSTNNTIAGKPRQSAVNKMTTAASRAKLGDVIADLVTKHNALCAKLDAANLTGMGTTNVATFAVKDMETR